MTSGFDSTPQQVVNDRILRGLNFNLIVVGPTGIGKTTLINSLFNLDYGDAPDFERGINDVELRVREYRPPNKTIDMKLTIIETKGFNNQLDRTEIYKPILDNIEARYKDYLKDELRFQDSDYNETTDSRIHCCIYMISPTARGLKPIDLVTMKKLHQRVCLVPVIGRSDQLTLTERQSIKRAIMKEIHENGIQIYHSNDNDMPYAIAASDDIITENGKKQRVRCFPWGKMYIDRDSDFPQLKDLFLRNNMLSLIRTTDDIHYEKYREEARKNFKNFYELKVQTENRVSFAAK